MPDDRLDSAALRARLEALGMSQADLARLTGRGASIVCLWCGGRRNVPAYVGRCLDLYAENRRLRRTAWKAAAGDNALRA